MMEMVMADEEDSDEELTDEELAEAFWRAYRIW